MRGESCRVDLPAPQRRRFECSCVTGGRSVRAHPRSRAAGTRDVATYKQPNKPAQTDRKHKCAVFMLIDICSGVKGPRLGSKAPGEPRGSLRRLNNRWLRLKKPVAMAVPGPANRNIMRVWICDASVLPTYIQCKTQTLIFFSKSASEMQLKVYPAMDICSITSGVSAERREGFLKVTLINWQRM